MATEQQFVFPDAVKFLSTQPSQNEISLVPYSPLEYLWTVPEHVVRYVARQMQSDGTFRTVFYDGPVKDEDTFIQMLQNPTNCPVFAYRGDEPIGFAWINGFSGNHGFGHFCFLRSSWANGALEAAKMIIDYWFSWPGDDGPLLDVILGSVPETNQRAVEFVQKLGFTKLGTIPKMLENMYTKQKVPAVILYRVR